MRSPPTKRMRLSSPTFDDQVGELSQDDIDAFDFVDAQLSQSSPRQLPLEDDENPFRSRRPCQAAQTARIHASFVSVSTSDNAYDLSDEAEALDGGPPEVDYDAWFNPDLSKSFVGFSAATSAMPSFQRPSVKGDNAKSLFVPSATALREAEEKMREWQKEVHLPSQPQTHNETDSRRSTQMVSPPRAMFSSARNAYSSVQAPETPTSASLFRSANVEFTPSRTHSSFQGPHSKQQIKPFKSPLIGATGPLPSHRQPSTPIVSSPLRDHHSSTTILTQPTPVVSPLRPSSVANHVTAQRPLGFTPRHGVAARRPKFVTPFKTVVKPIIPRARALENIKLASPDSRTIVNRVYPPSILPSTRPSKQNNDKRIFDLTPPPGRRTLAASGLRPQSHTEKQLEDMGINFKELSQVNPRTAPFYAFTTHSPSPLGPPDLTPSVILDRSAMLEELHAKGCTLAKQAWVDNHWTLVLWKLAGMVALDPTSENDPLRKRWCWPEVIRQFVYRYERDLNSPSRPPLRLIANKDASAESPMVLCISDIIWPPSRSEEDTPPTQTYPELEVTDGWYRLRARIDAPLARGVRRGKIKIGRKIAVSSARLSAERKEGSEILEAYSSSVLLLTGNSTHMAAWHARLGFQRGLFVATLNSLTADGGNVAVMMLTVIKAYPIAYIEFIKEADGRKQRMGPHDTKEELKLTTQWKTKRELHASRLWSEYEKCRYRLMDYAERLEQRVGSKFRPTHDDGPPDKIYDIYDTLREDIEAAKSVISSIDLEDAGWLARYIRERAVQERDVVSKEIEQELESICPPRDVKAFCVIVVNDARMYKHASKRTAQVTVWDVFGVSGIEGYSQSPFESGQQYLVTNLIPTQVSAWMDCSSGGEVYLSTRNNSKWTLVK